MAFDYVQPFPGAVPGQAPQFARSFAHEDWVDGESVVQAEANAVEDGFNLRFHRIEADLDALGSDSARALVALAGMRADLRALLDELRTEIQRLDTAFSEPWRTPALVNGWRRSTTTDDFDLSPPGFFKDRSAVVHLRGLLTGGPQPSNANGNFSPIFQLDGGYFTAGMRIYLVASSFQLTTRVGVREGGMVGLVAPYNGDVSLDGVCYRP